MFDFAFSELVVVGVVALVVLGPERLPKVARTAGHLFGRLQRYVATVKADLNREMDMSELSKVKQEVEEAARAFQHNAQQHVQSVEAEARIVTASLESPSVADAPTQAELLAQQDQGLAGDRDAVALAAPILPPARSTTASAPPPTGTGRQGRLDLGIEPVRGLLS
jgi:sec-independent protein translocase protein TatB